MKDVFGGIGALIGCILCIFALMWVVQGNSFFMYKFFAPKMEQVRRETFEQTKSYRDGMTTELRNMQMEYVRANKEQKEAMKSIILHRVNGIDENALPADVVSFINELRTERGY
jgi:hypothetical protein